MPKNLSALIRYLTIDTCLRNPGRGWTKEDLAEACGDRIREQYGGHKDNPTTRTIEKDIKDMRRGSLGFKAPIHNTRGSKGKSGHYTYSDKDFSILNQPLSVQEITALKDSLFILREFSGFPFLKEIEQIIYKIDRKSYSEDSSSNIIGLEQVPNLKGLRYVNRIYEAIKLQKPLKMRYEPFNMPSMWVEIHPYYLKEYRGRWYVFAWSIQEETGSAGIYPMGLDRIKHIEPLDKPYIKNTSFDPGHYFKHLLGISLEKDKTVHDIILSFNPFRGKYVQTKPIHPSQELIFSDDNEMRFRLKLVVNKELIREIISFREDVKVIAPENVKQLVKSALEKTLSQYD